MRKIIFGIILILFFVMFFIGLSSAAFGYNNPNLPKLTAVAKQITTFLGLTDTPSSYTGEGTNCVIVNAGETGLEFGACGVGGGGAGDKWIDGGTYIYPNSTFADNVIVNGYIRAEDWTNVSITESQISNLVHTGNASWNQSLANDLFLEDNTNINLGNYNGTFDWLFGKLNWSWLQNVPSYVKDWSFKLNATDQRYNETDLALSINTTGNIEALGFTQGAHTVDTNASTICAGDEVLLGDGTCTSSSGFGGADNGYFFNKTTSTMNANLSAGGYVGYEAGNYICDSNFSGTHLCTQGEIIRTIAAKNVSAIPEWTGTFYISSGSAKYAPADLPVNDCNGWLHGTAGDYLGNFWLPNTNGGGKGGVAHCGNERFLSCCKAY